jgi:pilus assembly protein FimV
VLREFNLVVDRPSATAEPLTPIEVQAPGVVAERSGSVERAPQVAEQVAPPPAEPSPSERTEREVEPSRVAPRPVSRSGDAVTVRRGDSLYNIAERLSRRSAASTSQLMVGLYRANPEAFGASMNDLRSGAVLRVPDLEELSALPPSTVAAEVNRAVSVWRNRGGPATRAADPGGRLRLVAPTEVAVGTGGEGRSRLASVGASDIPAGAGASKSAAPDETPAQRLARVEQELIEKERLLQLTSAQLADLQAKAAAAPAATQSGIIDTLRALFGKAWWSWALLLLAVFALVGVLMAVRRRAAAAEAELQAWSSAPRRDAEDAAAASTSTVSSGEVSSGELSSGAVSEVDPSVAPIDPQADDEPEGDPPTIEEAGSKIDLAHAFIEMGEQAAARAELEDVLRIGDASQRQEAQRLLDSLA